jgi:hypothetical protein
MGWEVSRRQEQLSYFARGLEACISSLCAPPRDFSGAWMHVMYAQKYIISV